MTAIGRSNDLALAADNARAIPFLSRPGTIAAMLLLPCFAWISFFFLLPLSFMIWRSATGDAGSIAIYQDIITAPLYHKVLITTLQMTCTSTLLALLLGYPVAYALTVSGPKLRGLMLLFVLVPYWVDIIVRSFSWLVMLGDNGIINKALIGLGLISHPIQLLYTKYSVLMGMVQILLPFAIVTLFGAMLRIDRTLTTAAKIHGANEWQAFRTVFFPLSLPGVYGAALLVFILGLGFYVTPALLGSPKETMIAQTIMVEATQTLDWETASAAGTMLLVISTAIAAIYNRYFSLDRLWGGSDK
ncbi:ABC transporter permease [Rhodoplanes sp. Z2-YC6860]|uniref:ABC transporter permease n=1 Tax=Rhodoplanes sp. Z2-YC6860 TaxID=674703 RepID=UPI00078D1E91|nr:ABC transporter permease [Rhodoplanes sp. Z2-YC6860]AMN40500.1 spermidine/putrescine ABC transporter permease I [Rhodoplanes sp. Z2-YC6860]